MGSSPSEIQALIKIYEPTSGAAARPFIEGEGPQHTVQLSAYTMYKYPVTVAQYRKFINEKRKKGEKRPDGSAWTMPPEPVLRRTNFNPGWSKQDHPIVNVTWDEAMAYCAWASGDRPGSVTLPTEAQWERAARGGLEGKKYPWGDKFEASKLWSGESKSRGVRGTAPVRRNVNVFKNKYGLVDMAGNVYQWCYDYYDEKFYGSRQAKGPNPKNATKGKNGDRTLRGSSWSDFDPDSFSRCAFRGRSRPDGRYLNYGFRCVVRSE
jgi:formylglycine-generating enzyme required for sulfatase activity